MLKGRTILILLIGILLIGAGSSCKKAKNGNLVINLTGTYNNQYFGIDTFNTDPTGKVVSVSILKFYLSHITLVKTNGDTVNVSPVSYFDFSNPSTLSVSLNNISGNFKAITFGCGIDSIQNNSIPTVLDSSNPTSPLSSLYDMYWPMLKYRFEVFEGKWDTSKAALALSVNPLIYHVGGNSYYRHSQVNQNFSVCCDNTTTLKLNLDVSKIFNNASEPLNMVTEYYTVCDPTDNPVIAPTFADNFSQAFTLSQ